MVLASTLAFPAIATPQGEYINLTCRTYERRHEFVVSFFRVFDPVSCISYYVLSLSLSVCRGGAIGDTKERRGVGKAKGCFFPFDRSFRFDFRDERGWSVATKPPPIVRVDSNPRKLGKKIAQAF